MNDNRRSFKLYKESPIYQLFVAIMIIMGVGLVLSLVLLFAGKLIYSSDVSVLQKSASVLGVNDIAFVRYLLITQDIALFIIPSVIILKLLKPDNEGVSSVIVLPGLKEIVLVIILAFCIFPITSFTGQFNSGMHLPDWLSGIEKWMIEKEDQADGMINQLITTCSLGTMILNLFMIAIIPAVGEELVFRGVFQRILSDLFKSGHAGIWITAFLFSALHFQFFGFLPRFILGLVFGYLFFWRGTLWLPVISHFVNNAFPVIIAYILGTEKMNSEFDISLWKQLVFLPLPVAISVVILIYFRNRKNEIDEIKSGV